MSCFAMDVLLRLLLFHVSNSARNMSQRPFTGPVGICIFAVLPDLLPRELLLLGPAPASPTPTQCASTDTDEID